MKRILIAVLTVAMVFATASTCLAYDDGAREVGTYYNGSFSKAWEKVFRDTKHDTVITYGYNTVLINEDYCYCVQTALPHWAELENGKGWHYGATKAAGKSSNIEVTHSGNRIVYYCCWG